MDNRKPERGHEMYLDLTTVTTIVVVVIVVLSMAGVGATAISPTEDEMGTIQGIVTHADGTPAEGVLVFADDGEIQFDDTTDEDGSYEIPVDPGTYDVMAFDEDSGAASEEVQVDVSSGETVELELTLFSEDEPPPDDGDELGMIQGVVTDSDGEPVEGALVQAAAGDMFFSDETSTDGSYQLEVDPGTYDVDAFHEDTMAFADPETISVDVDETVTYDIELQEMDGGPEESEYVEDISVDHVSGAAPTTMPEIEAIDSADGQISIDLMDNSQEEWPQELAALGVDSTTEFEIEVEFDDFQPRAVVATAHDMDIDIEGSTLTVTAKPLDPQWIDGQPNIQDWPEGDDDRADFAFGAMLNLLVLNLDFEEDDFSPTDHPMTGVSIATDAQAFSLPQYVEGDEDEPDALEIMIGGPHETIDGSENEGIYQAFLPGGLLDHWDVDGPDELTAAYKGDETDFSATETDDGILIEIDVSYSVGTVGISPEEPSSVDDTPTPTPPDGDDDPTPTPTPVSGDDDPTATPEDSDTIPGPGIFGVVLVFLGVGYLLSRRSG